MKRDVQIFINKAGGPISGVLQLGRNEKCRCGSGKKYKNCHWGEDSKKVLSFNAPQKIVT